MKKQRKSPATNEANPKNIDKKTITSEPLKSTKGVDLRPFKEGIEAARASIPQMISDPRRVFIDILIAEGFKNVRDIIPEKFQRYDTADCKRNKIPAWSVYYEIETEHGVIGHASYGNFQEGYTRSWSSYSDHKMSASQRAEYHVQREAMKAQREAEEKQRHSEAAKNASRIWSNAPDAKEHEYLKNKDVKTATGLKIANDKRLIIPVAVNNEIVSLQFIAGDGTKRFLTGGRLKGGWFMIEGSTPIIYIAEGYSTAASVHEATGATTYIAFNAGNLYEVAAYVKRKHPESQIIITADDDTESTENAGRTKAEQAANGLNINCIFPQGFNDFNDMHRELGVGALQNYLCPQNLELYEEAEQNIQDHITRPAGLMGEIYDYYNAVSGHEQKGWSVQTALAIISIVAGVPRQHKLDS